MNLNKNIVLLGMMGSGKSTIGYLLSKSINLKFLDVDRIIEKKTGLKINSIFEKKGEIYFRDLEEKITLKLLKNKNKIILALLVLIVAIILIDRINFPSPVKKIEKVIPNENFKIVK